MNNKIIHWTISGPDLPTLDVYAASFDEAIAEARKIYPGYAGGQVNDGKEAND